MTTSIAILEIRHDNENSAYTLDKTTTIGRAPENDVVLNESLVSRHHARIDLREGVYHIVDLGSGNGTQVNDQDIAQTPRTLIDGDVIRIGGYTLKINLQPSVAEQVVEEQTLGRTAPTTLMVTTSKGPREYSLDHEVVTLGRDPTNDIVIDDAVVSRHHAQFKRTDYGYEISDLGSANGLEYEGALISKRILSDGDELTIAQTVTLTYKSAPVAPSVSLVEQFWAISQQHFANIFRERSSMVILLLLPPLLGSLDFILYQRRILDLREGDAGRALMMFFLAGFIAFLVSAVAYVFFVAKHSPIFTRKRSVSQDITPYLLSRIGVAFVCALYFAAALFVIKVIAIDFSQLESLDIAKFFVALALTAMSGALWGLLLYSLTARDNKIMDLALLIILGIVQYILSGYIIPLDQLGPIGSLIGNVTNTRLGFIGLTAAAQVQLTRCGITDFANCRLPGFQGFTTDDERISLLSRLYDRFADIFVTDMYATWIAQAVILLALAAILYFVFKRKEVI